MFNQGAFISEFTSKKGKPIVFRFVSESDLSLLCDYVNALVVEDTFISFTGEHFTLEQERKIVGGWIELMDKGDMAPVLGFYNDELVVSASVTRQTRRAKHVGAVAISVKQGLREEGIGSYAMRVLDDLAAQMNLRMLELTVFANNDRARHVYQKHGYKEVGAIPEKILYKGKYIDEVIMFKRLASAS